jgi:hypothetical protein
MDKPKKDWTLGSIKEFCANGKRAECSCIEIMCPFVLTTGIGYKCGLKEDFPRGWDLTDPPRFTEQEAEDAKTLMRAFPGYTQVSRAGYDLYLKISDNAYHALILNYCMFPSIKDGETVELSDIIGGNND